MNLSNFYNNLVTNLTAAERIFDILDTDADIVDAKDVTELPDIKGSVEFSHVSLLMIREHRRRQRYSPMSAFLYNRVRRSHW